MTERELACLHCGRWFTPRKLGHVFCSNACRYAGARTPLELAQTDWDAIERLLDESRDPEERVEPDEWFAPPGAPLEWRALYAHERLWQRRRWFWNLVEQGKHERPRERT